MNKLLYVNACIRGEKSRTKRIADAFLAEIRTRNEYEIEELRLDELSMEGLHREELERRCRLVEEGNYDDPVFDYAKQFRDADRILIAAPFWDMGTPAVLRAYVERVSVEGITFRSVPEGSVGNCRAKKALFVTTRGFNIPDGAEMEQGTAYFRAVLKFWGIPVFDSVSAYGLDRCSDEVRAQRLSSAIDRAIVKARVF